MIPSLCLSKGRKNYIIINLKDVSGYVGETSGYMDRTLAQVSNADSLQEALYNIDPYTVYHINYAGGYMLQRYFAKQLADSFV